MQHEKNIQTAGLPLHEATKAAILLHGRGADAASILSLQQYLQLNNFALIAPQATNHTWYPYSFMAPQQHNEPWLSSAVELIDDIVKDIQQAGISTENIYFIGFSQGACLTLEYTARHARQYGGVIAFTGGLIGDQLNRSNYTGHFKDTPVFIGSSDVDMHVPVQRVYASTNIFKEMGASVTEKVYPGMGHTINEDEIEQANLILTR